jgi:quinol monooxygenase YgiN
MRSQMFGEAMETPMKASTSDIVVIAAAKAKSGKEADLEQALREVAVPTRAQPGCVEFSLYRASGTRSTIVGFERWASNADHQRHLQGAHVQKLMGRLADILAEPPSIVSYEVIDA